MDTLNSQIIIDDHVIHPQSHASNIIYGNTTAKKMLDNVLSSANLSGAVQSLLNCSDYKAACRVLKTVPVTYFDECFNEWTPYGTPTVSNGSLVLAGSQALTTSNKIAVGGDLCVQINFTTGSSVTTQQFLFFIYTASNGLYIATQINAAGTILPAVHYSTSATKSFNPSANISANTTYNYECDFDSANSTWYFFLNGSLFDSQVQAYTGSGHYIRLGGQWSSPPAATFVGKINEFRVSNCIRHTSNHSTTNYFELDANTVSLMHFD